MIDDLTYDICSTTLFIYLFIYFFAALSVHSFLPLLTRIIVGGAMWVVIKTKTQEGLGGVGLLGPRQELGSIRATTLINVRRECKGRR